MRLGGSLDESITNVARGPTDELSYKYKYYSGSERKLKPKHNGGELEGLAFELPPVSNWLYFTSHQRSSHISLWTNCWPALKLSTLPTESQLTENRFDFKSFIGAHSHYMPWKIRIFPRQTRSTASRLCRAHCFECNSKIIVGYQLPMYLPYVMLDYYWYLVSSCSSLNLVEA